VACRVLPLQALSLLLLPLPLTLPRLFGLLLANPVAIIEGEPTCACGPPTVDAAQALASAGTPRLSLRARPRGTLDTHAMFCCRRGD